jgi:S-adenosylmethionine:tRNA ribosyltransferase-isomerase
LIAQEPVSPRHTSNLLILDRSTGGIHHETFYRIIDMFESGDVIVSNDTKVLKARLFGRKRTGGKVEILVQNQEGDPKAKLSSNISITGSRWVAYVRGKNIRSGHCIELDNIEVTAQVCKHLGGAKFLIEFKDRTQNKSEIEFTLDDLLRIAGTIPTPPYVRKKLLDPGKYQTVYARHPGSIAAPTAGLHFSEEILERIHDIGVNMISLTLHVGPGTYLPVSSDSVEEHKMEKEYYTLTQKCARLINECLDRGKRLWIVGTTTLKTLETVYSRHGTLKEDHGNSDMFIYPPYKFKTPASFFLTNFHLPKSTLIMMIAAYAGREKVLHAYREAVEREYRFYSFGDAMLIRG